MTAEPIRAKTISTGVNRPKKMLLKKGDVELNAAYRYQCTVDMPTGVSGTYFRDCYNGEIAAFEMNRLLGLNNMPPTVYRAIKDRQCTLQLWAEGTVRDRERAKNNIIPPERLPVNRQKWDMEVFDNLINNFDRNQTNILIDPNWQLILIDHTRSFARDLLV